MADTEAQNLTELAAPAAADVLYIVDDPAGTPLPRKVQVATLIGYLATTAGDILYATAARTMARLGIGTAGQVLGGGAAAPAWINNTKYVCIEVVDKDTLLTIGNGKKAIHIPTDLNGMNLVYVHAFCLTASAVGIPTFQVHNLTDGHDMLSTLLTIDATETGSDTAAAPAVIDAAEDDVVTNDKIQIDCDVAGDTTKGVYITLGFRLP